MQAGDTALTAILKRDRGVIITALVMVSLLAWAYVLRLAGVMSMGGMDMPGMRMSANPFAATMLPMSQPWGVTEAIFMLVMWLIMMIGMMMPSAAPMILIYAQVGRQASARGEPLAPTGYFAAGYVIAWAAFSMAATAIHWSLERASLLTAQMASASTVLGGLVLIAAGIYQWTPLKEACLANCRAPLSFIQRHGGFRSDPIGSAAVGFRHGIYCVGCCWALMAVLFVCGVMNVLWLAGLAMLVLAEKLSPPRLMVSRLAGLLLMAAGAALLARGYT